MSEAQSVVVSLTLPEPISDRDRISVLLDALSRNPEEVRFLRIDGQPFSKARPRFTRKGQPYNTKAQVDNEASMRARMCSLCPDGPMTTNIAVVCIFYRATKQRIDVDNMVKQVLDAGIGVAWVDDMQVTAQLGVLELDVEYPRTLIGIAPHKTSMQRLTHVVRFCLHCEKAFKPHLDTSTYCSRKCASQNTATRTLADATCPTCGETFRRIAARQRYCSNPCKFSGLRAGDRRTAPLCGTCGARVSRREYRRCWQCFQRQAFGRERSGRDIEVSAT
jgi:Holliday junction resolvase RusA-like endonuclease